MVKIYKSGSIDVGTETLFSFQKYPTILGQLLALFAGEDFQGEVNQKVLFDTEHSDSCQM